MPFQIKDFNSITLSQINHARSVTDKITDFVPGSVARTLMESTSVEVEELYLQIFLGLRDAIPVATFRSFGFERLPASTAQGFVSVSVEDPLPNPITIPVGAPFTADDGRSYEATEEVIWAAGTLMVQVPVQSTIAGLGGNIGAGLINASSIFSGVGYTISNSVIQTGRDAETDSEREARFSEFVRSMSRGTVSACLFAAKSADVRDSLGNIFEYVTRVGISEEPGHVRIYVYSSLGSASDELLADGQLRIDGSRDELTGVITPGVRSAGVQVDVLRMVERVVPLSIAVDLLPGYTLTVGMVQSLNDIFASQIRATQPGATLYLGTVIEALLIVTGVQAIVPSTSTNFFCDVNEALVPGVLTVSIL